MYNGHVPFLLSGGINSYSANALKEFKHPRLAGYDLNSRFELKPGEKDPERILSLIHIYDTIAVKSIISWEGEKKWLLATRWDITQLKNCLLYTSRCV